MRMLILSPPAGLSMLLESGEFASADGALTRDRPGRRVVLSRALCRYRHFRAPAGLSPRQVASAARTFAQAHAPYEDTGSLIFRTPLGAGVWFWDQARVAAACADAAPRALVPEPLLRGPGEGWRLLECVEGYEAQYWESGALIASTWRRNIFAREQWAAFVLGVDAPLLDAPDSPPALDHAPLRMGANWRRNLIGAPLTWRDGEQMLLSGALCALALAAFFGGQAMRHDQAARADTRAAAALEASMSQEPAQQRVRERLDLLRAYQAATASVDALGASSEAIAVLAGFGLEPLRWRADQEGLSVTAPGNVNDLPVRDIVTALEATASLCGVEPAFGQGEVEFRARISAPGAATCGAPA